MERDRTKDVWQEDHVTVPHQKAMMEACKAGKLSKLQKLFTEHSVEKGDEPIPCQNTLEHGPPPTILLLATAVRHGRRSLVAFLLSTYPTLDVGSYGNSCHMVRAILERPDLATFKLLHSRSPNICSYLFDDHCRTFLTEACCGGPKSAPLVHFLLDNGADPMSDPLLGQALLRALQNHQPIDVIQHLVSWAPISVFTLDQAVRERRVDALRLFGDRGQFMGKDFLGRSEGKDLLEIAEKKNDKGLMAEVEIFIRKIKLRLAKQNAETNETAQHLHELAKAVGVQGVNQADLGDSKPRRFRIGQTSWQSKHRMPDTEKEKEIAGNLASSGTHLCSARWWSWRFWRSKLWGESPASADAAGKSLDSPSDSD